MTDFIGNDLKIGDCVAYASVHGFYAYDVKRVKIIEFGERTAVVELEDGSRTRTVAEDGVLTKLAKPLSDQISKVKLSKKDAVGQDIMPGSKVIFARSRDDRDSKGFLVGGTVTRITDHHVFAKLSEDAPEVRKTRDKTVVIG